MRINSNLMPLRKMVVVLRLLMCGLQLIWQILNKSINKWYLMKYLSYLKFVGLVMFPICVKQ